MKGKWEQTVIYYVCWIKGSFNQKTWLRYRIVTHFEKSVGYEILHICCPN